MKRGTGAAVVLCSLIVLACAASPSRATQGAFPPDYYGSRDDAEKGWIDGDGAALEKKGICSAESYRQVYNAWTDSLQFATVADQGGEEFQPPAMSWFTKWLASSSYVSASGATVNVSSVQRPDDTYDLYGTTVSDLDLRHEQIFAILAQYTRSSPLIRLCIRRILRPYLASSATVRDKLNSLNAMGWTQYDTPEIRSLIAPLLADPNEAVRNQADLSLHMLIPAVPPVDPWDKQP